MKLIKGIFSLFFTFVFVFALVFGGLVFAKQFVATEDKAVNACAKEEYSVYTGEGVYEYWRQYLNESEQVFYDEMREASLQFMTTYATRVEKISKDEIHEVFEALLLDHPEIFWLKSYSTINMPDGTLFTKAVVSLEFSYSEKKSKAIKEEIEPVYNDIIYGANQFSNDWKKIDYVHDRLVTLGTYSYYDKSETDDFQSLVSIFREGRSVCSGYAYGFKFIMDRLGVPCVAIQDNGLTGKEPHIWNEVKCAGNWYGMDITWDDQLSEAKGIIAYDYFMCDLSIFYQNHYMRENVPM